MSKPWSMGRRGLHLRAVELRVVGLLAVGALALGACSTTEEQSEPQGGPAAEDTASAAVDTPAVDPFVYVALGDSYTAAHGVPTTSFKDGCRQSDRNYPTIVGERLAAQGVAVEVVDASCSGAATIHMERERDAGGSSLVPAQFDSLREDADLVTLSIGYNDFRLFHTMFGRCAVMRRVDPQGSPCRDLLVRPSGFDLLEKRVEVVGRRVAGVVRGIRERAPQAQILVVSYPHLVPEEGTCPERIPLAPGDYPYVRGVNTRMAQVLETAAGAVENAGYVDVTGASEGHDACSEDAWMGGVDPMANRGTPFHPFAVEQRAVAGLVLQQVDVGA
ncbi:SGNH/GDSL hydrolase family protein [Nocardioides nanhaiensis]|uniref:SGNH/GDSL hydrolase family protein n=1 Tax=Nocardioides nanhaiensis TaxID=1476871 RepID=A0ABP8VSK6_9ACTN